MLLKTLDARLNAAYNLIDTCKNYADIGADHGLLPLHLMHHQKVQQAIVADISALALIKARANFAKHHLQATFVVADGLEAITTPQDFISILGMGGQTMNSIVANGQNKLFDAKLILSPHTDIELVRQHMCALGYHIAAETLVFEGRRYYVIMRFEKGDASYTDTELLVGPCLLKHKPPLFHSYLLWREQVTRVAQNVPYNTLIREVLKCL